MRSPLLLHLSHTCRWRIAAPQTTGPLSSKVNILNHSTLVLMVRYTCPPPYGSPSTGLRRLPGLGVCNLSRGIRRVGLPKPR